MILRVIVSILFLLPATLLAQVKKQHTNAAFWPSAEVTHTISNRHFVFLDHQWRYNSDPNSSTLSENGITSSFEEIRFTLGYEHNLSDKWRAGFSQRLSYEQDLRKWYSRLNLRHRGKIGAAAFVKRALFEHIRATDKSEEPQEIKPENRIRFTISLEQPFTISEEKFSAAVEYETLLELVQADETSNYKPRRIDRTRLQAEISYFPSPKIGISVYAIKQTRYYNTLPTFNESGEVQEAGGKLNRITPIFGLELQINTNLDEIDPLRNRR